MHARQNLGSGGRAVCAWFGGSYPRLYGLVTLVWCTSIFLPLMLTVTSKDQSVGVLGSLGISVVSGFGAMIYMLILNTPAVQRVDDKWRKALAEDRLPWWVGLIRLFLVLGPYWVYGWVPAKICDWYFAGRSGTSATVEEDSPQQRSAGRECGNTQGPPPLPQRSMQRPPPLPQKTSAVVSSAPAPSALRPGDVIGENYEVQSLLGEGGFGVVYLVYDRKGDELYAVKTVRDEFTEDLAAREAFRTEAAAWVDLDEHPFVLEARWIKESSGRLFVVTDYIAPDHRGRVTLQDHLEQARGPLDQKRILKWAIQCCHGMEHAIAHGIKCHRDIKPANILIAQVGTLKISDFGLAVAAEASWRGERGFVSAGPRGRLGCSILMAEGRRVCGTPGYIPPEVYEGKGADTRSDIYSFGIVLWQMATGSPYSPFHAPEVQCREDAERFIREYQEAVYRKQREGGVPKADGPLQAVIQGCLALDPARRYQEFSEVRVELEPLYTHLTGQNVSVPSRSEATEFFWVAKGNKLGLLGRHEAAIECFDRALGIAPRDAMASLNRGVSLSKMGRHEGAITCFDNALNVDASDYICALAWLNKGAALADMGRHADALLCYDQALELDPQDPATLTNKGLTLGVCEQAEEALECFERAIEIAPRTAAALSGKGIILGSLGRLEDALACFDEALAVDPCDRAAWFNKATAEENLGRRGRGIRSYEKFIELAKPGDEENIAYARERLEELR